MLINEFVYLFEFSRLRHLTNLELKADGSHNIDSTDVVPDGRDCVRNTCILTHQNASIAWLTHNLQSVALLFRELKYPTS